jgi:dGTPase
MKKTPFQIYDLRKRHAVEKNSLAPYACLSKSAGKTRVYAEPEHGYRTPFQRDRDRIIHSRAFRRLKHKRQVFLTNVGDHYRTRLTHTMEVSQLARTIARALGLNEDLTEAIAIGHDLGHTPFGHLGEVLLNEILQGKHKDRAGFPNQDLGGFKHNYQSLRVLDVLETKYAFPGLNLTGPVREGILKHTRLKRKQIDYPGFIYDGLHFEIDHAVTLEGQIVAMADELAQRTHDLEDGIRAELVDIEDIRRLEIVLIVEEKLRLKSDLPSNREYYQNRIVNGLIDLLVTDLIQNTIKKIEVFCVAEKRFEYFDSMLVSFSKAIDSQQKQLNKFIYQYIIGAPAVNESNEDFRSVLFGLYTAYIHFPELLIEHDDRNYTNNGGRLMAPRMICDHIAGMTDNFALTEYKRLHRMDRIKEAFGGELFEVAWMQ